MPSSVVARIEAEVAKVQAEQKHGSYDYATSISTAKSFLPMKIRYLDGQGATTKVCSVEIYQPYSNCTANFICI